MDASDDTEREAPVTGPQDGEYVLESRADRRRRGVRQLLFVIAGSHTGAFLGSVLPTNFGLPGDAGGIVLIGVLFALPFVVDANWERIERVYQRLATD